MFITSLMVFKRRASAVSFPNGSINVGSDQENERVKPLSETSSTCGLVGRYARASRMALAFASWFFSFPLFLSAVAFRRIGLLQIFCNKLIIAKESVMLFLINGSRMSLLRIFNRIFV